ncbi:MAG: hypothetical protein HKN31_15185 [Pricia sp.]|nr:hypothetical protein [Pricia sp.]
MSTFLRNNLPIVLFALILGSCVNLKHVGEFSKTSVESIDEYDALPISFLQICVEDCEQKHIQNLQIHDTSCDCKQNKKADSITQVIFNGVRDYLIGLTDISQNKLTNYQTDDLTNALGTGDFGPLKLAQEDVNAFSKVSTVILRAFTDGYRRNKIKAYVTDAHEPLLKLLRFLELNLTGNMKGKLEVQKSSLKNFYFDFVRDKNLSVYERTKFAEDYFQSIAEIEKKQKELDVFAMTLQHIAEGHKTLKVNIDNLTDKKVKGQLARYASRLKNIASSTREIN